jgi:hypothetical protein
LPPSLRYGVPGESFCRGVAFRRSRVGRSKNPKDFSGGGTVRDGYPPPEKRLAFFDLPTRGRLK